MSKYDFIKTVLSKLDNNHYVPIKDLNAALNNLHYLQMHNLFPDSKAEAMRIGKILAEELAKYTR